MPVEFPKTLAQLRESRRRQLAAALADSDICRHCFQTDHKRRFCDQAKVIACSGCYKLNVFTTWCCEKGNRREITDQFHQVFRFAGFPIPRLFIDVNILTKNIPALFCTGTTRSKIDYTLANFIRGFDAFTEENWLTTEDGIDVPIEVRGKIIYINCEVTHLEPSVHMVLGMDYIMRRPFRCTFDNITLDSRAHWAVTHQDQVNYVYNLPRGLQLNKHLRKHGVKLETYKYRKPFQPKDHWKQYFSRHEKQSN